MCSNHKKPMQNLMRILKKCEYCRGAGMVEEFVGIPSTEGGELTDYFDCPVCCGEGVIDVTPEYK